jgi:hypothetical protein
MSGCRRAEICTQERQLCAACSPCRRKLNTDQGAATDLTIFREILALAELGREQVLSVEGWAEIRRLRRAEQMPIAVIAWVMGVSRNTVKAVLASG